MALRWGFVELGRFAAQDRQRYGEVPSETLGRVRGLPVLVTKSDRHGTRVTGFRLRQAFAEVQYGESVLHIQRALQQRAAPIKAPHPSARNVASP